jgi:hypothetical protein
MTSEPRLKIHHLCDVVGTSKMEYPMISPTCQELLGHCVENRVTLKRSGLTGV